MDLAIYRIKIVKSPEFTPKQIAPPIVIFITLGWGYMC